MDIEQTIRTELARFEGEERTSEALRWAVWMVWEDLGFELGDEAAFAGMTSTQFADAAEKAGVKRNTAMNRYSEARRNWVA